MNLLKFSKSRFRTASFALVSDEALDKVASDIRLARKYGMDDQVMTRRVNELAARDGALVGGALGGLVGGGGNMLRAAAYNRGKPPAMRRSLVKEGLKGAAVGSASGAAVLAPTSAYVQGRAFDEAMQRSRR